MTLDGKPAGWTTGVHPETAPRSLGVHTAIKHGRCFPIAFRTQPRSASDDLGS